MSTFESYRSIVPTYVEDKTLRDLLKQYGKDQAGLERAINALWEDPSSSSEWVTTSKNKKSNIESNQRSGKGTGRNGGRSNAGRGRGPGGRGSDARGVGETLKPIKSHEKRISHDTTNPVTSPEIVASNQSEVPPEVSEDIAQPVQPVTSAPPSAWGGKQTAWTGLSMAERLKQQEQERQQLAVESEKKIEVSASETPPVDTAVDVQKSVQKSRNKRSKGRQQRGQGETSDTELTATTDTKASGEGELNSEVNPADQGDEWVQSVTEETSNLNVNDEDAAQTNDENKALLKVGEWEAPVAVADINSYQFGFSSLDAKGEDSNKPSTSNAVQKPEWGVSDDGKVNAPEQHSTPNIWGESTSGSNAQDPSSTMNSLFPQGNDISGISALESSLAPAATNESTQPPPGLDPTGSSTSSAQISSEGTGSGNKVIPNTTNAQGQAAMQSNMYQQPLPYGQLPPGIPATRPANAGQYGFLFDQQGQFMHMYNGGSFPPGIPPPLLNTNESENASSTNQSGSGPANAQNSDTGNRPITSNNSNAQAQQFPPTPFPFGPYGNPYYNQAFYYGQPPVPNFYGQGRGLYHQRGPYGTDPYGANQPLYPHDMYSAGQFPNDGSGSYGGMMPQGTANTSASTGNSGKHGKGKMGGQNSNQTVSQMQPNSADGNLHPGSNYGYMNPYNSRGIGVDPQAWPYPQNQSGGWGTQMMQFPNGASGPGANSYGVPQGQQASNTRGNDRSASGNQRGSNAGIGNQTSW